MLTDDALLIIFSVSIGFLLTRLAEILNRMHERRKLHYDTLVALESQLHELSENAQTSKSRLEVIENAWKTLQPSISDPKLELLEKSTFHGLLDLKLKNRLFTHSVNVQRASEDLKTITDVNAIVRDRFTRGVMSRDEYRSAVSLMLPRIEPLQKFIDKLDKENMSIVIYLMARIRKDEPILSLLGVNNVREVSRCEIEKEEKRLEAMDENGTVAN